MYYYTLSNLMKIAKLSEVNVVHELFASTKPLSKRKVKLLETFSIHRFYEGKKSKRMIRDDRCGGGVRRSMDFPSFSNAIRPKKLIEVSNYVNYSV